MTFTSILKSIGSGFKLGIDKAVALELKLLPAEKEVADIVTLVDPAAGTTLTRVLNIVGGVEQVAVALNANTGTGAQKLAVALPAIENVVLEDPIFAGKKIGNLPAFNDALSRFAGAFVDLVDSVESITVTTGTTEPVPVPVPTPAPSQTPAPAAGVPLVVKVPSLT